MKNYTILFLIVISGISCASTRKHSQESNLTVYAVRNNDGERGIHRVFSTEKTAKSYVNYYSKSHNYTLEILELGE